MSGKCRMRGINTGIQDRDLDRTIWSSTFIKLMRQRQMDFFWRPLSDVRSIVATCTPGIAGAPGVSASLWWCGNEIWFNEENTRVT
jgi:hypothetical protein